MTKQQIHWHFLLQIHRIRKSSLVKSTGYFHLFYDEIVTMMAQIEAYYLKAFVIPKGEHKWSVTTHTSTSWVNDLFMVFQRGGHDEDAPNK